VADSSLRASHRSLRVRLPLLMLGLVSIVLAIFMAVAFRLLEDTLVNAGKTRAQAAATQLADMMRQSVLQRNAEAQRVARDESVRLLLQHPTDEAALATARQRLTAWAASSAQPGVQVWDAGGTRILSVAGKAFPDGASGAATGSVEEPPRAAGVSAFRELNGVISYDVVADIVDAPAEAGHPSPPPLGHLVIRRSFSSVPTSDGLRQLLGSGAVVKLGNHGGSVWTDLKTIVPPPPPMAASGAAEYTLPDGSRRLGANVPIAGSPWAIATEFPREVAVAPARAFLTRALLIALACILLATIGAHLLSRRITSPLHELTAAAEAISAGDYSHPVAAGRGDEIGRLGVAFNAMLGQVRAGRRDLEQRVAERVGELEAAREETDRFFSLALDLLCIADGSHLKRVNPAWQKVLGWSPDELTSRSYLEFVHPEDIASTERETARLSGSLPLVSFANRYRCKDGTYRWLEWKAARAGKTGLIFAAARDITEQRRAADSQATHIGELAALNQELEAFSYSVSHDLRAPLRHVTGFAALLDAHASATLDEKGRRYLTTISAAASRMGRLIDDLLTFSRMGRTPLAKRRVPLDDLVQDVRREVSAGLDEGKIEWNIRPLPTVEADPSMLRLAMINLLSNAVKYSSPRTPAHIEVGTNGHHGNGDETVFFVRDNGVGFDMQYAPKLFGVFQRLHGADEFEGTGIGLANVRRIIQRHGGRVWAEAEVDRGATFFVSLPGKGNQ
jgi:PAS domain S-box-containing protein